MSFDPVDLAASLIMARQARVLISRPPEAKAPATETEAAAVQRAIAAIHARRNPDFVVGGFKIGATAPVMQRFLGVAGPVAGFMAAADIHRSNAVLCRDACFRSGVECELAVTLGRDLPPGPCSRETAEAAVGTLSAAIEIVADRYHSVAAVGTHVLIADQMFHAAAVVGEAMEPGRGHLDLGTLAGHIIVNGDVAGQGVGADLLGHPLQALAWLAASPVARAFGGLRAGQVILLGSVTPTIWLDQPALVTVNFPPLPAVELRLL